MHDKPHEQITNGSSGYTSTIHTYTIESNMLGGLYTRSTCMLILYYEILSNRN